MTDLTNLKALETFVKDQAFREKWRAIKAENKRRLFDYIQDNLGITPNRKALVDIQIKRIHQYKRQYMNILGVIFRYIELKKVRAVGFFGFCQSSFSPCFLETATHSVTYSATYSPAFSATSDFSDSFRLLIVLASYLVSPFSPENLHQDTTSPRLQSD